MLDLINIKEWLFMFDKDFFWNFFLNTGRIDAYLLLKNEDEEVKENAVVTNSSS